uniref:Type 1 fimbrial protein n=1 Tax=Edwardsiella tarda TaxID=636 RepID=Q848V5_EDWTA|nr:type 1 fimbrial protein [Edwardsiella tarda]
MKRIVAALLLVSAFAAHAGIQVDATRVIYNGDEKSASLPIHNDSADAYMVQTWLDKGDSTKVENKLPMVVVPPIVKLFYRSEFAAYHPGWQVHKLRWQKAGNQLLAINDGPLHITFGSVQMQGSNGKPIAVDANMVDPHSRLAIAIPAGARVGNTVSFSYINDFGGRTEVKDAIVH